MQPATLCTRCDGTRFISVFGDEKGGSVSRSPCPECTMPPGGTQATEPGWLNLRTLLDNANSIIAQQADEMSAITREFEEILLRQWSAQQPQWRGYTETDGRTHSVSVEIGNEMWWLDPMEAYRVARMLDAYAAVMRTGAAGLLEWARGQH